MQDQEEVPKKSDIDFDELDKAVTSLMRKVGGEVTEDDSEKTKTLAINPTLKPDEKPRYDALGKAAEGIGNEALVSDKEVELVEDLTEQPPEEEKEESSVVQTPVAQTSIEMPASAELTAHESSDAPIESPVQSPTPPTPVALPVQKPVARRPNKGRFMDVVRPDADMRSNAAASAGQLVVPDRTVPFTPAPSAKPTPVAPPATPFSQLEAPKSQSPTPTDTPLVTPFLPDTKVEKRPLGGGAATSVPSFGGSLEPIGPVSADEADDMELEEKPVDNGGGDSQRALNATDFEKETPTEQELVQVEAVEPKVDPAVTLEKVESGDTENLKAQPSASDSAIYDVKDYHQPLAHPAKQKSGWSTVIIIVIIIVVAALVAGGTYLFLTTAS